MTYGEEQDNFHASKIYHAWQFVIQVYINVQSNSVDRITYHLAEINLSYNESVMFLYIIDQKEITIDETYCWSTDHLGRPIDIYSDPDYRMQCIGYWKENLKSYLITYDQLDAFTKYRCWVGCITTKTVI